MSTFEMKMKKKSILKMVDLFFNYFDKGSRDAILNISMEMQQSLIFIYFIQSLYILVYFSIYHFFPFK